jgi:hypothetical protein
VGGRRAVVNAVVVPIDLARSTADEEQARYFLQLFGELRQEKSESLNVLHSSPYPEVGKRTASKNHWRIERLEQDLSDILRILAALQDRWIP